MRRELENSFLKGDGKISDTALVYIIMYVRTFRRNF